MRYRTREETLPLRRSEELSPRRQVRKREHCVHLLFNLSLAIFAPWREILLENVTAGFSEANWPTGLLAGNRHDVDGVPSIWASRSITGQLLFWFWPGRPVNQLASWPLAVQQTIRSTIPGPIDAGDDVIERVQQGQR
jgi:hypothetical protein